MIGAFTSTASLLKVCHPSFFRDLGYWGRVAIAQGSSTSSPYAAETPKAKEPLAGAFTGDVRPRYATKE